MDEKLLLLINPVSGDGAAREWMYDMVQILSKRYAPISVYLSKSSGDICKMAQKSASEYDVMVCCGGDGTFSEMLDGVIKSGATPKLGYVPMGTVNDYATSRKISKNVKEALLQIAEGTEHEYDVGMLGERAFSYVAAFGAFTDVAYQTKQDVKQSFGMMAYLTEAAKRLPKLKPIKAAYTIDGERREGEFIYGMVSNTRSVGGMNFFGAADKNVLSDGVAEVTLVKFPNDAFELGDAIHGLLDPKFKCPGVLRLRAEKVDFEFENDVPWTVDGEYGGTFKTISTLTCHKRIKMIH